MSSNTSARNYRGWIVAAAVVGVAFALWWLGSGARGVDPGRTYRIGFGNDAPLHFQDADGAPAGIAVELVSAAAARRGIKLQWVHRSAATGEPNDLTVLQAIRPRRGDATHFTAPYLQSQTFFVVLAESPHRSVADLRRARISALSFRVYRETLAEHMPDCQVVSVEAGPAAVENLVDGRADAALLSQYSLAESLLRKRDHPSLRIIPSQFPPLNLGLASTAASAPVAEAIRREMGTMGEDGSLAVILSKWDYFPNLVGNTIGDLAKAERQVRWLALSLAGLAVLLLVAIWLALRWRNQTRRLERVERALRVSEGRFRSLVENAPEAIVVFDLDHGTFADFNEKACSLFQLSAAEMRTKGPVELSPPVQPDGRLSAERAREHLLRASRGESPRFEWTHRNAQGVEIPCEVNLTRLPSAEGVLIRGSIVDITERKRSEAALKCLATNIAHLAGRPFFEEVSRHLAAALGVDYVFVGQLGADRATVIVQGGMARGERMGEMVYSLADTPCANVLGEGACVYPQGIQALFPRDHLLAQLGVEGYLGAPVLDKQRQPIGIIVALHSRPIANAEHISTLFNTFLERVSAEMQRSQAEEALRTEHNLAQNYIDTVEAILVALDGGGRIQLINRKGYQILGYAADELRGRNWFEACLPQPDGMREVFPHFRRLMLGEVRGLEYIENSVLTRQGELRQIAWHNSVLRDANGVVTGTLSAGEDVTERRKTEQALKESEERFRTVFEEAGDAMLIMDGDRFTECSRSALTVFGATRKEELIGHALLDYSPTLQPDGLSSAAGLRERLTAALAGGSQSFEWHCLRRNASPFLAEVRLTAISVRGRQCLQAVVRDISERKRAETEMRILLRNAPVGIASIRRGRIVEGNEALCEMLGYSREEILQKDISSFGALPAEANRLLQELRGRLTQEEQIEIEVQALRKDGVPIDLLLRLAANDPVNSDAGTVVIALDITERKRTEALQQAKAQAESANRAKSAFLARMSHEIRTPMNAILGFAQLLGRDVTLSGAQREHLRIIGRNGEHLMTLINDILEMSKIEAEQVSLQMVPFDLPGLVRDLQAMFAASAEAKGLQFVVEAAPNLPGRVVGDGGKVRQILVNLLANAVKFTARGRIVLRVQATSRASGGWWLRGEVEDTGPGIEPGELERLFRPFEQATSGRKSGSGSGLGLAISREFARLMGGDVTVETVYGRGSNFRVEVRLAALDSGLEVAKPGPAVARPDAGGQGCRVLVVDDLEDNRRLLREMLRPTGCEVWEAGEGSVAVAIAAEWRPCAILMDVHMPGMGGCEATRAIRALPDGGQIRIICHSASAFADDRDEALAAGADGFMSKPFSEEVLWRKLGPLPRRAADSGPGGDAPGAAAGVHPIRPLPLELAESLHKAVLELDMDRFSSLLKQVSAVDPAYAQKLGDCAAQYDFSRLLDWIQPPSASKLK